MLYAIYFYLSGLSLRQTSRIPASLNINRSHEAVRLWIHKLATKSRELVLKEGGRIAIVDETGVNVGGLQYWLWIAIEPKRRAVLMLTGTGNNMRAYSFLVSIRRRGVRHVITDAAHWLAAKWAKHSVVRGGVRSYVEGFMGSVKDRLRGFDCYSPQAVG